MKKNMLSSRIFSTIVSLISLILLIVCAVYLIKSNKDLKKKQSQLEELIGSSIDGISIIDARIDENNDFVLTLSNGEIVICGGHSIGCKHEYSNWEILSDSTCSSLGIKIRKCSLCQYNDYEIIVKQPHNMIDFKCSKCSYSLETDTSFFEFTLLADDTYSIGIKEGKQLPEQIYIPSTYEGKIVSCISKNGFKDSNVVIVELPSTITLIDNFAFSNCSSLTRIALNNVETINEYAFEGCSSLIRLDITETTQVIKTDAFKDCDNLVIHFYGSSEPATYQVNWFGSAKVVYKKNS